jgi:penicillin-binding protein 1A
MVSAYTAFVNHGIRAAHMFVTKIEDSEGNVVAQFQPRMNEVISEESANKMLYMLKAVVDGGTATRLRYKYNFKGEMAGKTGTTNDNSDGWFIGYTPSLSFGAWVGGDERDIHFNSMALGQGANASLPIAALFLQKVYADPQLGYSPDETFDMPAGFNPCNDTYDMEAVDEAEVMGVDDMGN